MAARIGLLVFLAVFLAVFGALMAAFLSLAARRARLQEEVRRRLGADGACAPRTLLRDEETGRSSLARLVAESGLGWTMQAFLTRSLAASALGLLAGVLVRSATLALLLAAVGAVILPLYARRARARRRALCDAQMPQALEIMALALRAGHPLATALAIAAGEAPAPLADDLRRACDEHELGRPLGDVLVNLGRRVPSSEAVHTFVVAVLVLQQTGGNIISVIDRIVENARARAQYRARLRALTAEGRSSARVLAAMPVAFAVLAGAADPTYFETLLHTGVGNVLLAVTATLWLLGILWTRRLVRTEA